MLKVLIAAGVVSTLAVPASAGQRAFYDRSGAFAGSASSHGNSTSYYSRSGSFAGSAVRNSNGTTTFYTRSGSYAGSSSRR